MIRFVYLFILIDIYYSMSNGLCRILYRHHSNVFTSFRANIKKSYIYDEDINTHCRYQLPLRSLGHCLYTMTSVRRV